MRRNSLAIGEYYHICGRASAKNLYRGERDYLRFLFNILYFQSDKRFYNISRYVDNYQEDRNFGIDDSTIKEVVENRSVAVAAFCLMPNHYHLIVKNISSGGISRYMQRVLTGYSRFFHTKHDTSGHVFAGSYNLIRVRSDKQMQYLLTYVHKNPKELLQWRDNYTKYPWSSCRYVQSDRWSRLLDDSIITDQFDSFTGYKKFLNQSSAKGIDATTYKTPAV